MKSELEELEEKVAYLKKLQANCDHEWEEPVKDTMKREIEETYWVGVDCMFGKTGRYEDVPCYSRTCKLCGKKEYSTKMEDVVIKTERRPKF